MSALRGALAALWRERFPERPEWSRGLHPHHVRWWIVRGVLEVRADVARMRYVMAPGDRDTLSDILDDDGWDVVAELGEHAARFARDALDRFAELPLEKRPAVNGQRCSEKACGTARNAHLAVGALQGDERSRAIGATMQAALEEFCGTERERAPRKRALLGAQEFEARHAAAYDDAWTARDVRAHASLRPRDLGVGRLDRPPLRGRANWFLGTDRSVVERYKHLGTPGGVADRETRAARKGLDPDRHMSVRLARADPDRLARSEIGRACEPLGLSFAAHRTLVDSLVRAVRVADLDTARRNRPGERRTTRELDAWARETAVLPSGTDDRLEVALRGFAETWAYRNTTAVRLASARAAVGNGGATASVAALSDWTRQVEIGVGRRLWWVLLRAEIEWDAPLTPEETPAVLKSMFGVHLRDLVDRPIPDPATDDEPRAELDRVQDVLAVFANLTHEDALGFARQVVVDRDDWRGRLAVLVEAHAGPDAAAGLDTEAFRDWLIANMPVPTEPDDGDDPDDDGTA